MENQPEQLDPQAVMLAKAIRQTESGGNFTAHGKSGEYGGYQYTNPTWLKDSAAAGVNVPLEQATPQQQNQVAYTKIKKLKDSGMNVGQISSVWNAGEGEHDAYLGKFSDGSPSVGVNKEGVNFNVPTYAKSVATAYQKLKAGQSVGADPNNPSSVAATGQNPSLVPAESTLQKAGDVIGSIGGALFPIIPDLINDIKGKNDKSALQQVGDAGLSAAWFLPFGDIAEGLGMGARALGLGKNAASAAGIIGTGLATGYGSDVASNLSRGQTGASVLKPGLGTALGGALPVAGIAGAGLYNKFIGQQAALRRVENAYTDAFGATKAGQKANSAATAEHGQSLSEFLSAAGIPPETQEVNGRRIFTVGPDSATYKTIQERASNLTKLRDQVIEANPTEDLGNGVTAEYNPRTSNLNDLRSKVLEQIPKTKGLSGTAEQAAQDHINAEFDAYARQYGADGEGNISLSDMNKIKSDLQGKTNYDATRPSTITRTNKVAAALARQQIEKDAEAQGVPGVKALNKIIQQHLDFLDTDGKKGILTSRLNGQILKGGRLGNIAKETTGALVGGAMGAGGGPIGVGLGALAGGEAGNLVSKWLQFMAAGGPRSAATIGRMATEDPKVVRQFLQIIGKEGEKIAPNVVKPTRTGTSIVKGLVNRSPGSRILSALR